MFNFFQISHFAHRRLWPMPCSTTRASPISTSGEIRLVIRVSRPGSCDSPFLSDVTFFTSQALPNALQHSNDFGDAGRQARWVAGSEESMLPGAARWEALQQIQEQLLANEAAAKAAWNWTGIFQYFSACSLKKKKKKCFFVTFCFWFFLLLLFDFKISRDFKRSYRGCSYLMRTSRWEAYYTIIVYLSSAFQVKSCWKYWWPQWTW